MSVALIAKEWRQHRWKLAYGCVLVAGCTVIALRSRLENDVLVVTISAMAGAVLMAVFTAMGVVAEDRAEASCDFTFSLPIRPRRIFAAKMIVAAIVSAGSLVATMIAALAIAGGREITTGQIVRAYCWSIVAAWAVMVWAVFFSIRQDSESKAAMVAFALLVIWILATAVPSEALERCCGIDAADILPWTPLGLLVMIPPRGGGDHTFSLVVLVQAVITALLLAGSMLRFHRLGRAAR